MVLALGKAGFHPHLVFLDKRGRAVPRAEHANENMSCLHFTQAYVYDIILATLVVGDSPPKIDNLHRNPSLRTCLLQLWKEFRHENCAFLLKTAEGRAQENEQSSRENYIVLELVQLLGRHERLPNPFQALQRLEVDVACVNVLL